MLRSWLLAILALVGVGAASAGWAVWMTPPPDRSTTFEEIGCGPSDGPFLSATPLGEQPYPAGEFAIDLRVFNPGPEATVVPATDALAIEHYRPRSDGRLDPRDPVDVSADAQPRPVGIPAGAEAALREVRWRADEPGEHVLVLRTAGLCGMAWYSVA